MLRSVGALLARKTYGDEVLRYKLLSFLRDDRSAHELSELRIAQYRQIDEYGAAHSHSAIGAAKAVRSVYFCRFYSSSELLAETATLVDSHHAPLSRLARDVAARCDLHTRFKLVVDRELASAKAGAPTYAKAVELTLANDNVAGAFLAFEQRLFDALVSLNGDPGGLSLDTNYLHALFGSLNREALVRVAPYIAQDIRNLTETPLRLQNFFRVDPVY